MIRCSPIPSKSCRKPLIICSRNCSRKTDFPESGCSLASTVSPPTVIRRRTRTYNNEVRDGRQRGFWLIDDMGRKQPVYLTLQQYYRNARVWLTDFLRQQQRLPSSMEFGGAAVQWLQ
jgi:hypothetical protein